MQKVLRLAAVGEATTGVALLTVPSLVGWLLFGEEQRLWQESKRSNKASE
jgi:hypothetical protein